MRTERSIAEGLVELTPARVVSGSSTARAPGPVRTRSRGLCRILGGA